MLKKIACNATNSAGIDIDGRLWVWGSTRYGLCGDQDSSVSAKAASVQGGDAGNNKGFSIATPVMLPLVQTDTPSSLNEKDTKVNGKPFSAFNLLDPPLYNLKTGQKNSEQVFVAMHISYGQYHAGVVCNDISTNYEFERLPVL